MSWILWTIALTWVGALSFWLGVYFGFCVATWPDRGRVDADESDQELGLGA